MAQNSIFELLKSEQEQTLHLIETKKQLVDAGYTGYKKDLPQHEKELNDVNNDIKELEFLFNVKENLLNYIDKQSKNLKEHQYKRNQAHALIVEGELSALEKIRKKIEGS